MTLPYQQQFKIPAEVLEKAQALAASRIPAIWEALSATANPFMAQPFQKDDLPEIQRWGDRIRERASHLVVLGTGGSSLGAMTLTALRQPRYMPSGLTVHYLDNADPDTLDQLFSQLPLADTFFMPVSKSGNTVETLAPFLLILETLLKRKMNPADQCLAVTMAGERSLRQLAGQYQIPVLEHAADLGGRFSVLSNVGLLPAAAAGADIFALRAGAESTMQAAQHSVATHPAALGAAIQYELMQQGVGLSVVMPYADRLENLGRWFQQLWAESVGKKGKGTTPVRALGAVDQHSQLQLYLDGPKDKFMTLIGVSPQNKGAKIPVDCAKAAGMEYIAGHQAGTILAAQMQGTIGTMRRNDVPLREITLPGIEEYAIGALLQHYMLETCFMAGLLGVNAFDQPAVEESKQLAREWLAQHHNDVSTALKESA